jgi:zinc protease
VLLVIVAAGSGAGACAVVRDGSGRLVTTVEGITEYELSNGLHVLLFPEPSKPTITVNMTYLVGSRYEGYGETGMAHLLEHMLFKGSTHHPNVPQELSSHGSRPNGSTSDDRTNYFETFAATDENLKWALSLEADRMVNSFVARKDLDTEMTVVRNEYEMGENDPANVLEERIMSTAFLWHNYGHPTIGARSDIENVPIERLQAFYRKYYQPDNAVLLVAGKFDPVKTLALVDRTFSPIPRPKRILEPTYTREPPQDGERTVTLERVGDAQVVAVAYHAVAGAHPDAPALDIMAETLGSAPSGRLYKALVDTKKAARVWAYFETEREPGIVYAGATVRRGDSLPAARAALLDTIDALDKTPPTPEEVERSRATFLKDIALTQDDTERIGLTLSEWIAGGDWRLYFLYRDRLRAVTPADVARVAATYLKPSNRTLGEFLPTDKPDRVTIPEAPAPATILAGYKGDPEVAKGEAFDPTPAHIESRTTRTTLPSGLKLAFLPKKTRGGTVFAALNFRFGDEKSLSNQAALPRAVSSMLMRGTTQHTREQLRDQLDRLKAHVNIYSSSPGQVNASIETERANFPAVLSLVAEMLRSPSFPQTELDSLRQEWTADLEQQKSEPRSLASTALSRHLAPYPKGDPRYISTLEELIADVAAVTRDGLVKFHDGFYGASNGELAVVGDFDATEVKKQIQDLFGDWKSPVPFARVENRYFDQPPVSLKIETPDKENAMFLSGYNLPMRDDDADYPALLLGNYMLGGGFLNSRLATRIRQKEGISYSVGSMFVANPLDKAGTFGGYAIYAPQNADRLYKAFDEEITRAVKDGFDDKEISDAKAGWLQSRQLQRAQDGQLVGLLAVNLFVGRTLDWDATLERRVTDLKATEILAAMRRHISLEKLTRVKAGDFARVTSASATPDK